MLYAGGSFTTSGTTNLSKIAKWDGANWAPLGVGMDDGNVYVMRVFSSSLYVGGTFTMIGASPVNRIARWDGQSWANSGFGFSSGVYSLSSIGTLLYAGGDFDFANLDPASKIAVWNGTTWGPVGTGISGSGGCGKGAISIRSIYDCRRTLYSCRRNFSQQYFKMGQPCWDHTERKYCTEQL